MNEEQIIELAKNGNNKAMAELVRNYEKTIYNFAFKICRNPDRAENITQETFLSMVKSLTQFDGKSKLSTWLYRIVSNHCLMEFRKNRHEVISIDEDEDGFYDNNFAANWHLEPQNILENSELKQILDDAITKLSPEYRVVFLLRDVEGLSTEETGKITELTVSAVKSRLHRARAFLRKELNEAFKR